MTFHDMSWYDPICFREALHWVQEFMSETLMWRSHFKAVSYTKAANKSWKSVINPCYYYMHWTSKNWWLAQVLWYWSWTRLTSKWNRQHVKLSTSQGGWNLHLTFLTLFFPMTLTLKLDFGALDLWPPFSNSDLDFDLWPFLSNSSLYFGNLDLLYVIYCRDPPPLVFCKDQ